MGYRQYMYKVSKENYEKFKNAEYSSINKIKGNDGYEYAPSPEDFLGAEKILEFGKWSIFSDLVYNKAEHFFITDSMNEAYEEEGCMLITEEVFLEIISFARQNIYNVLRNYLHEICFTNIDNQENVKETLWTLQKYFATQAEEWKAYPQWGELQQYRPANLRKETKELTTSWKYEYSFFDMVRIYKEFDFEKDVIIFLGY